MPAMNRVRSLLKLLFHRQSVESDLNAEVDDFYQTIIDRYVAQGMTEPEARRQTRLRFETPDSAKEKVRDTRTGAMIDAVARDVRHALRSFRKAPAFAFVTVLTLGLGIGANSTIFSIISRFILQSPPVSDPVTLMALHTTHDGERCCNSFSWPLFIDVRDGASSFSGIAGYYELVPASISGAGDPERVWGQATTENYFQVAELPMALGRGFSNSEADLPVVVIGYRLWQRRFGADPAIAGKTVRLSGRPFTVVGVAAPGFRGLDLILDCQFWVPLGNLDHLLPNTSNRGSRVFHWINAVGRLRPGKTSQQASAELRVLAQRFAREHPESEKGSGFRLERAASLPPRDKRAFEMFFAALSVVALLVLCIACANVANLALAQASGRRREMAIRLAIGAARIHLLRQLVTESLILALGGGLCAVALSVWATHSLSAFRLPAPVPLDLVVAVDWRVLIYTFVISAGAGLVCGLAPAWTITRRVVASARNGEDLLARPGRFWNFRNLLVSAQIAMSLVLLCTTSLFLRSLQNASRIDVGFRSRDILMMAIDPRLHGYTTERTARLLSTLGRNVATIPGVRSVAFTDSVPLSGGFRSDGFRVEGRQDLVAAPHDVDLYMVTPGFFETIGIPQLAGRDFRNESANALRVAVVNQTFVTTLFQGQNSIGQRVSGGGRSYQIIGVVKDIKSRTLGEESRPVLFRALSQDVAADPSFAGYSILVRFTRHPADVATAVRREIHSLDATLAVFKSETMQQHLRDAFFLPQLASTLFGVFGFLGLSLASVGLYASMSYWVSLRRHEIGVRLALGAQERRVQGAVIGQGMLLAGVAIVPGLSAALAFTRIFRSVLYELPPNDTVTFSVVPLFLVVVALLACWIPSRRAALVEPATALRHE